ncbi:MAG: Uma2 family endonuclease [Salinibacter sp.]
MTAVATRSYTIEEYLELDAEADDERYEFQNGSVIPMAGAEPEHNQIKDNISSELRVRLQPKGCWVMTSDQRVRVSFGYVYPDVVVACDPTYEDTRPRTLRNPELIVEVTSESTEARDHSDKLAAYTELDSLQECWMVHPEKPLLTQYTRDAKGWRYQAHTALSDTVESDAFEFEVPLHDLYALVLEDSE